MPNAFFIIVTSTKSKSKAADSCKTLAHKRTVQMDHETEPSFQMLVVYYFFHL